LVHRWRRSRGCGWACSYSARDEEELIAAALLQETIRTKLARSVGRQFENASAGSGSN
jgi:hypothetical protein